jgi:hypothetical protein
MKTTIISILLWLWVCGALQGQQLLTNQISRARAVGIASGFWKGMPEEGAAYVLEEKHKFMPGFRVGTSAQWDRTYLLRGGSFLTLRFEPERIREDGAWKGGLLKSASISGTV